MREWARLVAFGRVRESIADGNYIHEYIVIIFLYSLPPYFLGLAGSDDFSAGDGTDPLTNIVNRHLRCPELNDDTVLVLEEVCL